MMCVLFSRWKVVQRTYIQQYVLSTMQQISTDRDFVFIIDLPVIKDVFVFRFAKKITVRSLNFSCGDQDLLL